MREKAKPKFLNIHNYEKPNNISDVPKKLVELPKISEVALRTARALKISTRAIIKNFQST